MTEHSASLFWHDYETWGARPQVDRPVQFAGVRTDLELNLIDRPVTWFAQPTPDYLPHPAAVMITGITPQHALNQGMCEREFATKIHHEFSQPATTIVGYNNVKFDDEVTRFLFYRNFYDPYAHTWQHNNARWDLIDLVRACYALRPEGIEWPYHDNGQVSLKLEHLSRANQLEHGKAHDAMSDVYATIGLAKLIKQQQPKLFQYSFSIRKKRALEALIDMVNFAPLLHIAGHYGAAQHFLGYLMPLGFHPQQPNTVLAWDLRVDPQLVLGLSATEIRAQQYQPQAELDAQGLTRPALQQIALNKCPFLATPKVLDEARRAELGIDTKLLKQRHQWLREHAEVRQQLLATADLARALPTPSDPDLQLYSGPFFSPQDQTNMAMIRALSPTQLAAQSFNFADTRLPEMLFRYRARNFPATLSDSELKRWRDFCQQRLLTPPEGLLSAEAFMHELQQLSEQYADSSHQLALLKDLYRYVSDL